mmetsp:Transcript_51615/g.134784  ORF Transcript_51615/g.134784 Transcript_51615/m.134784 type:complete len:92 (+) Transcript_51615:238-513(+)
MTETQSNRSMLTEMPSFIVVTALLRVLAEMLGEARFVDWSPCFLLSSFIFIVVVGVLGCCHHRCYYDHRHHSARLRSARLRLPNHLFVRVF